MFKLNNFTQTPIKTLGLGVFDGCHLGHQQIISQCDAILSLYPHPDFVLKKNTNLKLLSTPEEMKLLLPNLITLNFDESIAKMTADSFFNLVIKNTLKPKEIIVGYDYSFGYKKQGNLERLTQLCATAHIKLKIITPFKHQDSLIKSSFIRKDLLEGNFETAIKHLGHPYLAIGTVIKGENRGKELGFPTANLAFSSEKLIPQKGVYSGSVILDGTQYDAMIYIGSKPTFKSSERSFEVHILNFSGDLYKKKLIVQMTHFIRDERKFDSKEDLIKQIKIDISKSRTKN